MIAMDEKTRLIVLNAREQVENISEQLISFIAKVVSLLPKDKKNSLIKNNIVNSGNQSNIEFVEFIKNLSDVLEMSSREVSEPFMLGKAVGNLEASDIFIKKLVEKLDK